MRRRRYTSKAILAGVLTMGIGATFEPQAIRDFTQMDAPRARPPAAEFNVRVANIAGFARAMGSNESHARTVASQIVDTFCGATFQRPLAGVRSYELPRAVVAELEMLGSLLLAGAQTGVNGGLGEWAFALATQPLDSGYFKNVAGYVGHFTESNAAAEGFRAYVRANS